MTTPIPGGSVSPGGEEAYGYQQIMPMMHGLDPGRVTAAAKSFQNLAEKLENLRRVVQQTGDKMAAEGAWQGAAATSAMNSFQQLHDQTAQLSAESRQSGNTLEWLGGQAMPPFKKIPDPQVASKWVQDATSVAEDTSGAGLAYKAIEGGPDGNGKANSAAQDYLKTFNGHLQTAYNAMPSSLATPSTSMGGQNLHKPGSGGPGTGGPGNSGGGGGGNAGGPGAAGGPGYAGVPGGLGGSGSGGSSGAGVPGAASPSGVNPFNPSKLPGAGSGGSSTGTLQGYTPPPMHGGGNPPYGAPGGTTGGGGPNPFARMPVSAPGGIGGAGTGEEGLGGKNGLSDEEGLGEDALKAGKAGLPSEDGAGLGGEGAAGEAASGAEGAAGEAAGAEGATAAGAAEGEGGSALPMGGGGGGGQQDKERQRQAWMSEDESIWGVPDTHIGSELG